MAELDDAGAGPEVAATARAPAGQRARLSSEGGDKRNRTVRTLVGVAEVPAGPRDERIAAVAGAQRGRLSYRQLVAAGVSDGAIDRAVSAGRLRRKHRGVYAVGHDAPIELGAEAAALLAVREGAALSHHSAAALWAIAAPGSGDGRIHVVVRGASMRDRDGIAVHRSRLLESRDLQVREGLPVTSPARTLLDLAPITTPRALERTFDQALIARLLTLRDVRELLVRAGRHRGRRILQELVDGHTSTTFTRSHAEERFLSLVRSARLPPPQVNVRMAGWEVDFLWADRRVAVEIDGFAFHRSRFAFERDRRKDAGLRKAGVLVLRFSWRQLEHDSIAVIADLSSTLASAPR